MIGVEILHYSFQSLRVQVYFQLLEYCVDLLSNNKGTYLLMLPLLSLSNKSKACFTPYRSISFKRVIEAFIVAMCI